MSECDLPGCEATSSWEPANVDDDWPPEPPPGWVSLVLRRHGVQEVLLEYCSQDHLTAGVRDHLPAGVPVVPYESRWTDTLLAVLLGLLVVTVLVLGLATLVVLLVDGIGWVVDRV